eukprot:2947027-Amphidinium_carterae.2
MIAYMKGKKGKKGIAKARKETMAHVTLADDKDTLQQFATTIQKARPKKDKEKAINTNSRTIYKGKAINNNSLPINSSNTTVDNLHHLNTQKATTRAMANNGPMATTTK